MNKTLVAIGMLALLAFGAGFYAKGITGNVIFGQNEQSYTKAICHESQCLDVYVQCNNGNPIITPITPYTQVNTTKFNITNEIKC
ncbi:MAG TPA: hypothetical protein VHA12_03710 [Candidatus Nanoarchaeia archaeon]|nr:hypothetical protein [Candidatus Nanoarchaeia archaeon]